MRELVEPFCVMGLEHAGHGFDRWQAAADGRGRPVLGEASGGSRQPILPEAVETLLVAPCPAGLQIEVTQQTKDRGFAPAQIRRSSQPLLLGRFEQVIALLLQCAMFRLAHLVHRFVEVLGHVKAVMHHISLRQGLLHAVGVGWSCVHGNDFPDPATFQIVEQCRIAMSAPDALVHPNILYRFGLPTLQTPPGLTSHDSINLVDSQPHAPYCLLPRPTTLNDLNDHALHELAQPALAFRTTHRNFLRAPTFVVQARHPHFDESL